MGVNASMAKDVSGLIDQDGDDVHGRADVKLSNLRGSLSSSSGNKDYYCKEEYYKYYPTGQFKCCKNGYRNTDLTQICASVDAGTKVEKIHKDCGDTYHDGWMCCGKRTWVT